MIIYIASYPRSGNSWVSQLFEHRFRYLTTDIHGDFETHFKRYPAKNKPVEIEGFQFLQHNSLDHDLVATGYRSVEPAGLEQYLLAPPRDAQLADPKVRQYLAEHENCFVLKTHLLPYDRYFDGEFIVQPVRHPGASTWSYFCFLNDVIQHPISLEDVIKGEVTFGGWADFHTAWDRIGDELGGRMLRVSYESLFEGEAHCSDRLSAMTGLPILSEKSVPFSHYHQIAPLLARFGTRDAWTQHIDDAQFDLLVEHHGPQMQQMGYSTTSRI